MTARESGVARLIAVYRIRSDSPSIEARAQAIAVEQSVEMPVSAIDDPHVLSDIVGRVESIGDRGDGSFDVRIALSLATTGLESGQLMNMLFGNTSIQEDVSLDDVVLPTELIRAFGILSVHPVLCQVTLDSVHFAVSVLRFNQGKQ